MYSHADSALASLTHDLKEPDGSNSDDVTFTYGYNKVNQLVTSTTTNAAYDYRYFDPAGVQAASVHTDYTVNGLNQYDAVGGVTLGYDDNGNLTGRIFQIEGEQYTGGELNYVGVGMLAAHYDQTYLLPGMVNVWNIKQILAGEGFGHNWREVSLLRQSPALKWARYGASQY